MKRGDVGERYLRPTSIPSTNTSETLRSTVFAALTTGSGTTFRRLYEVEKARVAIGVRAARRKGVVLVRKDILMVWFGIEELIEVGVD